MKWLLPALLISLAIMAGCVSGDDGGSKGGTATSEPVRPGDVDANSPFGVLQGSVVQDDQLPIAGAEVGLRELEMTSTSDESGLFQFRDVQPGTYTLDVAKLGYEPVATEVVIVAGQLTERSIVLRAIEIVDDGYYMVSSFNGYYECALGAVVWVSACSYPYTALYLAARDGYCVDPTTCAPPIANLSQYGLPEDVQKNPFRYNFTVYPGAEEVVSEMRWNPSSAASTKMMLTMSCGDYDPILDDCPEHYGAPNGVEGTSPLRMQWQTSQISAELPAWVMARGYLPFFEPQVALNQKFELWNTVFYNQEAPDAFSIFSEVSE